MLPDKALNYTQLNIIHIVINLIINQTILPLKILDKTKY